MSSENDNVDSLSGTHVSDLASLAVNDLGSFEESRQNVEQMVHDNSEPNVVNHAVTSNDIF